MKYGELIAYGKRLNVYREGNTVVKVFEEDYPQAEVLYEAMIQARVQETGLNVPRILEVSKPDGQWQLIMDYIEGKTFAQLIEENPEKKDDYIKQFVEIQLEIHSKRSPRIFKLKDKLVRRINNVDCIDDTKRYEMMLRLDSMPKHVKLCHGNYRLDNVIVSGDKVFVVDWISATQGNASADAALTYMFLCMKDEKLAGLYLDAFCEQSNTNKKYVIAWLPIVAASRLYKNVPEERDFLMRWVDVVDYD